MSRRICVFTGTRAEYGLLRWLLEELRDRPDTTPALLVGGAHFSAEHGTTSSEIELDGFRIDERLETHVAGDTPTAAATTMGLTLMGAAQALKRLAPDVLVVLGDRYEALAVAQAALLLGVPVAHLHGGETTEGAIDESIRHAITKLSHLHFVAAEPFRERVVQLGEDPARVHVVGALGLDGVRRLPFMTRPALEAELGVPLDRSIVVTMHPVTLQDAVANEAAGHALVEALDAFPETSVLMTRPNADPIGDRMAAIFRRWAEDQPARVRFVASLGQRRYLSSLRHASAVVGNSSSGLIEAPAVGTPTVDIGIRQAGRLRGDTVVHCDPRRDAIVDAIGTVTSDACQAHAARSRSPYGDGRSAPRIAAELARVDVGDALLRKAFHDLRAHSLG